jgi:predicted negative regulator of RcsB-dependent stress response
VEDLTDNESEELLRRWWSDNWLWLVGGIVIGLGGLAGWQYWQKSKLDASVADAATYKAEIDSLGANQYDAAAAKARQLRDLHPNSPYADQADLALARAAVERNDLAEAAKRLKVVAEGSRDPQLRQIAKARLGRVLVEQGKHDEALAQLDIASAGSFGALYHEIRGDALAAKGDTAGARQEYDAALAGSQTEPGIDKAYVELKREALAAASMPAAAPSAAPAAAPGAAK